MSQSLIALASLLILASAGLGYAIGWRQRGAWPDVLDVPTESDLETRVRRSQQ